MGNDKNANDKLEECFGKVKYPLDGLELEEQILHYCQDHDLDADDPEEVKTLTYFLEDWSRRDRNAKVRVNIGGVGPATNMVSYEPRQFAYRWRTVKTIKKCN